MKIAIDAGHGLYTSGKRCLRSLDKNETREWTLNQRVATKLTNILKEYDCQTKRVDDTDGLTDVSLSQRCQTANDWGADFYLSIHHNAGINGGSGGGVEIFAITGAKTTTMNMRDKLYDAAIAQTALKGDRANPKTTANLYVLKHTKMPAVLIECGYMDSATDTPIILTEDFADKCAKGLANGVVKIFDLNQTKSKKASVWTTAQYYDSSFKNGKKYKVCAELNMRKGAGTDQTIIKTLKNGSYVFFYGYYTVRNGTKWYYVQQGTYTGFVSAKYLKQV